MRAEVVPDDRGRLVAELVAQAVQHADALAGVVGALQQVEPHPGRRVGVAILGPVAPQPAHRDLLATPVPVAQHRRLPPRCPGPPHRRGQLDARLVDKAEPGSARLGVCLIRGHSSATHRAISASLRSTALRAGRCRLHRIALSRRHTCPGWCATPVVRSITSATRARVHRSLSNPAATAPRSSTRRTLTNSAGPSWAGLPWRAVRSPAVPPSRQRLYQRLAVWADTPSSPATSALVLPWANRSAACSRRRSNHCRSPGCRSTRPLGVTAALLMPRSITHSIH